MLNLITGVILKMTHDYKVKSRLHEHTRKQQYTKSRIHVQKLHSSIYLPKKCHTEIINIRSIESDELPQEP